MKTPKRDLHVKEGLITKNDVYEDNLNWPFCNKLKLCER